MPQRGKHIKNGSEYTDHGSKDHIDQDSYDDRGRKTEHQHVPREGYEGLSKKVGDAKK